jgi:hypothetical protein
LERLQERGRENEKRKKKSIFFELPYWKTLLLRQNLDVMHIEKHILVAEIGTLADIEGCSTKDTLKARLDLQKLGIRKDLHPCKEGNKYVYRLACYSLSKEEKFSLWKFFKGVKMPDGYASNRKRCIQDNEFNISCLKTHDCHVIFQQLLPHS